MTEFLHKIFLFNTSLCKRLAVGLAFMLVPLILVIAGTFFSQNMIIENLAEIAEESTEEIGPVLRIHKALHEMMMPVHDYLIGGDREKEIKRFEERAAEVEKAFEEALAGPFALEAETKKVREAHLSWKNVKRTGRWVFDETYGPGDPQGVIAMKVFDAQIDETLAPIDDFYQHAQEEIIEAERDVSSIRTHTRLFVAVMLAMGLGMALLSAFVLSRSILGPMQILRKGVSRLEAGDLVHRVDLPSRDEFGILASAFNRMAQELEKNHRSLEELSYRDELTGLNNRRRFLADLNSEIMRSERYGDSLGLLLLDIDHFKKINDTYGHSAGDLVLQRVATALREALRGSDAVSRIGGEEFGVILPKTTTEALLQTAERVRAEVEALTIEENSSPLRITISIGAAIFPDTAKTVDDLYKMADKGLYRAKEGGRNRVGPIEAPPRSRDRSPASSGLLP